jgi:outer membrane protein assembly factor BamA
VLVVEGITLSSSLKRDLEEKWNEAVVDAFLIQEAETLIASHLAGLGHLRPTVRGESQLSEDRSRQTITLRVDPGPRVAQTVVRVTGAGEERQRQVEALAGPPEAWREIGPVRSAIRDWYHGNGWLDADVTVGEAVIDGTTATLPVTVTEGRQYHVAGAAVVTPVTRPSTEIEAAADLTAGAPFTPALIERTRRLVEVDYRRHGFNEARVIASAAPDAASATVTMNLSIEEGPQQVVGSVVLDPDMRTRDRLLARALAIQLNTPVSFEALYQGRQRAFATGVFRRIDFDVQPQGAATVDASGRTVQPVAVNVNVEEVPVYRLRYGFGLNEDRSFGESNQGRTFTPGAVGEFTRLNLFGRAITAGTSVRYERRQQILRGFLGVPRLFGLPISSHVFGSRQRNSIGEDTQRPAVRLVSQVSLEQRFRPLRHMQVSYGYIYERNRTNPVNFDPDDFTTFPVVVNVARLAASVAWDHRDDPFDATRGWFHGSTVEYSSERLGSVLRFSKYLGQGYYYRPVGPVVVASAVRFGVADAYGQVLIPSEKFQAGGGHSVRGYSEDAAGPSDFFGPTGGDALLVLNQEVRFPVWKWVRGVGFVDAGAAFADFAEMSFGGLAKSIGAGVRLDTPIGLFRLDYGVPLSTGFGDKRGRWFFAIGQMF